MLIRQPASADRSARQVQRCHPGLCAGGGLRNGWRRGAGSSAADAGLADAFGVGERLVGRPSRPSEISRPSQPATPTATGLLARGDGPQPGDDLVSLGSRRAAEPRTRRRPSGRECRTSRSWPFQAAAASNSSRSPAWWPCASLNALKSSTSSSATDSGSPDRRALASSRASCSSQPRRMASPVSGSVRARRANTRTCSLSASNSRTSVATAGSLVARGPRSRRYHLRSASAAHRRAVPGPRVPLPRSTCTLPVSCGQGARPARRPGPRADQMARGQTRRRAGRRPALSGRFTGPPRAQREVGRRQAAAQQVCRFEPLERLSKSPTARTREPDEGRLDARLTPYLTRKPLVPLMIRAR
jgi:hypothetical protein